MGTLGPDAALEADGDPALLSAPADAAFGSAGAVEEGMFLGSFPERRSTIVYPVPADPVIFEPSQGGSTFLDEHDRSGEQLVHQPESATGHTARRLAARPLYMGRRANLS